MEKLYKVKRNSLLDISHLGLTDQETGIKIEKVRFFGLDGGIYTPCYTMDEKVIYLMPTVLVKILD